MTNASTMFSDDAKSIKIYGSKTCKDEICCLGSCIMFQYNSHLCHPYFNTALFSVRFATFALIFMEKALNCQSIINTMNKLITSSMLKKEKQLTSICAQFFLKVFFFIQEVDISTSFTKSPFITHVFPIN